MTSKSEAGKKTAATNKEKFGPDYYAVIGAAGGKKSRNGGFASLKLGPDGLTGPERLKKLNEKKRRIVE